MLGADPAECTGQRGGKRGPRGIFPAVRSWGIERAGQGVGREAGYRPRTHKPYRIRARGGGEGKCSKQARALGFLRTRCSAARRRSFREVPGKNASEANQSRREVAQGPAQPRASGRTRDREIIPTCTGERVNPGRERVTEPRAKAGSGRAVTADVTIVLPASLVPIGGGGGGLQSSPAARSTSRGRRCLGTG